MVKIEADRLEISLHGEKSSPKIYLTTFEPNLILHCTISTMQTDLLTYHLEIISHLAQRLTLSILLKESLILLDSLNVSQPRRVVVPVLDENLILGLQYSFMKTEIVHSADSKEVLPWISLANPVHECATCGAEVIRHGFAGDGSSRLAKYFQVFLPAKPFQIFILHSEV